MEMRTLYDGLRRPRQSTLLHDNTQWTIFFCLLVGPFADMGITMATMNQISFSEFIQLDSYTFRDDLQNTEGWLIYLLIREVILLFGMLLYWSFGKLRVAGWLWALLDFSALFNAMNISLYAPLSHVVFWLSRL